MTDELFCAKIPPMNTEGKKKKFPRIVVICIAVFLTYLAIHYWDPLIAFIGKLLSAAAPLFIGAIIAFIVNIFLRFYEKHFFRKSEKDIVKKLRRPVCILLSSLTVAAIITAIDSNRRYVIEVIAEALHRLVYLLGSLKYVFVKEIGGVAIYIHRVAL